MLLAHNAVSRGEHPAACQPSRAFACRIPPAAPGGPSCCLPPLAPAPCPCAHIPAPSNFIPALPPADPYSHPISARTERDGSEREEREPKGKLLGCGNSLADDQHLRTCASLQRFQPSVIRLGILAVHPAAATGITLRPSSCLMAHPASSCPATTALASALLVCNTQGTYTAVPDCAKASPPLPQGLPAASTVSPTRFGNVGCICRAATAHEGCHSAPSELLLSGTRSLPRPFLQAATQA